MPSSAMISAAPAMISGMLLASPKISKRQAAVGGGRNRDDVVEAHHDVGDDDDLHRGP